jgi:hypothetical protein
MVAGNPNLGFYFTMFVSTMLNSGTANLYANGCKYNFYVLNHNKCSNTVFTFIVSHRDTTRGTKKTPICVDSTLP